MKIIDKKINIAERTVAKNSSVKNITALSFRYYMKYRMGDRAALSKAYGLVNQTFEEKPSSAQLLLLLIFYRLEYGNMDDGEELIINFKKFANYYKNNEPQIYASFIYLSALTDLKNQKERPYRKNRQKLEDLAGKAESATPYLFLADLYLRVQDYESAFTSLEDAYALGSRSFFLYLTLQDIFKSGFKGYDSDLVLPFLRWANLQQALKEYHILDNEGHILNNLNTRDPLFKELTAYEFSPDWLLLAICREYIRINDSSLEAYEIYMEADKRQLDVLYLSSAILRASFIHRVEELSHFILASYLSENEIDPDMMPYLYHMILTKRNLQPIIDEFSLKNEILKFAAYSISAGAKGRYYNSIYCYSLRSFAEENTDLERYMASALYESLFLYQVDAAGIVNGNLFVQEETKREMDEYLIAGGKCLITASTSLFKAVIVDKEKRVVLSVTPTILKEVENADLWLYEYFYKKGCRDLNLYIALSNHYITLETAMEECYDILQHCLNLGEISQGFRIKVNAALGNILSARDRYDLALQYYNDVDINYLSGKLIELMVTAYLNVEEYNKAAEIILRKREYISDRVLFMALKKIAKIEDLQPLMADAAYELILNSWYDTTLLDIVLKYYNASQHEWQMLSDALSKMSVYEIRLDEVILENSIWMRDFSVETQQVFIRLYKTDKENKYGTEFVYYCAYEMLVNHVRPEYETLSILEKVYLRTKDILLSYGLVNIYMKFDIQTLNSDRIFRDAVVKMELDEFILPGLKEMKDKSLLTPYIEKNQPFLYHCSAEKKVFLNYKFDDEDDYQKKELKYLKFGLFYIVLPMFYNEKITYYFTEEMFRGSIDTREHTVENNRVNLKNESNDIYYLINNALIYDHMFKYEEAENVITSLLKNGPVIKGRII